MFYIEKLLDIIVFRLIHRNDPFFVCAAERMYLTAVNNNSNLAACYSPTYGVKTMPNDTLLRKSVFHSLSQISSNQQH